MRGRKPKPSELRLIEGLRGHRPLPGPEPKPEAVMPACPKWLSKAARAHWRKLAPQLMKMGVLTRIDGTALAAFCDCLVRYTAAVEFMEKNGSVLTVRDDKGNFKYTTPVPQLGIAKKMLEEMRALGASFGWSPADRARLSIKGGEKKTLFEIAAERAAKVRADHARKKGS